MSIIILSLNDNSKFQKEQLYTIYVHNKIIDYSNKDLLYYNLF